MFANDRTGYLVRLNPKNFYNLTRTYGFLVRLGTVPKNWRNPFGALPFPRIG
jgi:hypothetical protein